MLKMPKFNRVEISYVFKVNLNTENLCYELGCRAKVLWNFSKLFYCLSLRKLQVVLTLFYLLVSLFAQKNMVYSFTSFKSWLKGHISKAFLITFFFKTDSSIQLVFPTLLHCFKNKTKNKTPCHLSHLAYYIFCLFVLSVPPLAF